MDDRTNLYLHRDPGDLLTAEDWNDLQTRIKTDIASQVQQAKDEITKAGVDRAGNTEQFDSKTSTGWLDLLDQRYAPKVHDHEGLASYRRYIKEFATGRDNCLLQHNLGRFPLVDVYELQPVVTVTPPGDEQHRYDNCRILFYASHADADRLGLWVRSGRDKVALGVPFEQTLQELQIQYDDTRSIEDLVNDMSDAFMHDPNDDIPHCTTPWVDDCCERDRTVGDLKRSGLWDNLHIAMRARKCGKGTDAATCQVDVQQINYQTIYIAVADAALTNPMDLMILLRS